MSKRRPEDLEYYQIKGTDIVFSIKANWSPKLMEQAIEQVCGRKIRIIGIEELKTMWRLIISDDSKPEGIDYFRIIPVKRAVLPLA